MPRLGRAVHTPWAWLLALLIGCRGAGAAPAELRFWAMGREGEVVQQLLPELQRQHPEVHISLQQIPWSAAHEKLLTAFVGGAMPDVFQVGSTWIPELVALGAVAPVGKQVAESAAAGDDVFSGILDANMLDGRMWAMPWYVDTRLLFYRSDVLREAGWTQPPADWATWRRAFEQIKQRAGAGRYALLLPVSEWQPPVILAMQRGAALLRDGDRYGDFEATAFRDAFTFYVSLFTDGLAPASAEGQIANLYQDFAGAFFSVYITGPWNLGEFAARLPASLSQSWATAPMPAPGPDSEACGLSIAGGSSLAVSATSPHADIARQLVEALTDSAHQLELYRLTGDLPARRSAWTAGHLVDVPRVAAFWQQLQHVRTPPKIPEWERIADTIERYAEATVRGDLTIDQALSGLDRDVDRILAKRRWLLDHATANAPNSTAQAPGFNAKARRCDESATRPLSSGPIAGSELFSRASHPYAAEPQRPESPARLGAFALRSPCALGARRRCKA